MFLSRSLTISFLTQLAVLSQLQTFRLRSKVSDASQKFTTRVMSGKGREKRKKKKKERETKKTEGRKGKTASKNTIISSMTPQKSSHETRNYFTIMKQEFSGYLLPRPSSDGAKIHTNIISTYACSTWPSPEPETISMG